MTGLPTPQSVYREYLQGVDYKRRIGLYDTVRQNENFYIGRQWEGVVAPDLDKPVLNILGRVVSYFVAMLASDSIGVSVQPLEPAAPDAAGRADAVARQLERLFEQNDLPARSKDLLRDAAVDGDACLHLYFDASGPDGGFIRAEAVENTDVFFGNPLSPDKERQPHIILASRRMVDDLRGEMRAAGRGEKEIDALAPDGGLGNADPFEPRDSATVLCRYWRHNGSIWVCKTTPGAVVMPPTDTGYRRYPVAWMNWERVKGSCHGQAAVTGLIPNQISVNKLFAMAIKYQREMAFPKILFDRTKIERWTNRIGAIAVNGDPSSAVVRYAGGADMSGQVLALIDRLIAYTRDLMGASDAALGNIRPDNTSAIIAVQQATAAPLSIRRRAFYQMMEETARIFLDMMAADYGLRRAGNGAFIDFSRAAAGLDGLRVDIGESAYWSELSQMATLDNLFSKGIISDAVDYLNAVPEGRIRNKQKLIDSLKKHRGDADRPELEKKEVLNDALQLM